MNHLQAVFWDYPEFTNPATLRQYCQEDGDVGMRRWLLQRFLEHGRVVDTFKFFSTDCIAEEFSHIRLQSYTRRKWRRMLEVYGSASGK